MTTAVAKLNYDRPAPDVNGLRRLAEPLLGEIGRAMPAALKDSPERLVRCLMTDCQRTPALLDCSPKSLLGGVIQAAQLGLELGGPLGQAYLIPFKGQAQLIVGYKGYIDLVSRGGARRITPRVVREGDTFHLEYGTAHRLTHSPDMTFAGKPTGYYAVVILASGEPDFEFRTVAQVEAHRDRFALSKKGPWATHFDEMALKTCVRMLVKRLPVSVVSQDLRRAAALDDLAEQDVPQQLAALLPAEVSDDRGPDALRERLDRARETVQPGIPGVDEDAATGFDAIKG